MKTILVTGGTSPAGRPTVANLCSAGHPVRVLSRKPGSEQAAASATGDAHQRVGDDRSGFRLLSGDLTTGEGIAAAVEGVDIVVHLATSRGHADIQQAEHLIDHARAAGVGHLIYLSIVGVDQIPMPYYRDKLAVEQLITDSPIPHTILRATQFYNLVDEILTAQRFLPALLAPSIPLQPISVDDVAERLVELASGAPAGRVADLGGPERLAVPAMARAWKRARGSRRPILPIRLPGKAFRDFATGAAMPETVLPSNRSFDDYLSRRFGVQA
ncbi:NAD(P)H-binding protein [Kribbella qitaiheensis]|uniref:NAD(P)H-binding protein n=2 Tax=Kribbella qitaiheensis TaxID=1544730 RepID=A0A7G6X939_9ACTN|nr:NAD(P)H-binding protein [Kribbella qitaiheensis]